MRTAVIIPVHNEEAFIKGCLDSIASQSVMPDEVVVVNNRSTDRTIEICRQYSFVRIINEETLGICAATKRGFDDAAGSADILLRCDADSRPERDWVKKVVAAFSDYGVIAVTGPGEFYGLSGLKQWFANVFYIRLYFVAVWTALGQRPLFGSNCAIRSAVWKEVSRDTHLWRQDIHDDMDISFHIAKKGIIRYESDIVMPISSRPFYSPASLFKRVPMGLRSVVIHWPENAPWRIRRREN